MLQVFKYPVPIKDCFEIAMPIEAKILCVDMQYNELQMWALVDASKPSETVSFRLFGTGHYIPDRPESLEYISTFQHAGGSLIAHVFKIVGD